MKFKPGDVVEFNIKRLKELEGGINYYGVSILRPMIHIALKEKQATIQRVQNVKLDVWGLIDLPYSWPTECLMLMNKKDYMKSKIKKLII
jgi:hypothetical protein